MPGREAYSQAMLELRQKFVLRSRADLAALLAHRSGEPLSPEVLYQLVHRLSGAGGTFGFPEVSAEAEAVEARLSAGGDGAGTELDRLLAALSRAVDPGATAAER
jgi:HPt (histidine-containing phosphotransfer) domain-containing protein